MAKYIVHHDKLFFEWSTVTDAPHACAMTRKEFKAYYRDEHGDAAMPELKGRLERARANGCSDLREDVSAEVCCRVNRAGPNGTTLSFPEIMRLVREQREEYGYPPLEPGARKPT